MANADFRHRISVCTRRLMPEGRPGVQLQRASRVLMDAGLAETFLVDGIPCMAGCDRPVMGGFSAMGKASYLFGKVEADRDAEHLLEFAWLYFSLPDGWCSERHRPVGRAGKIIARIPGVEGVAS
jgi:predicted metal-binding protein